MANPQSAIGGAIIDRNTRNLETQSWKPEDEIA